MLGRDGVVSCTSKYTVSVCTRKITRVKVIAICGASITELPVKIVEDALQSGAKKIKNDRTKVASKVYNMISNNGLVDIKKIDGDIYVTTRIIYEYQEKPIID